MTFFYRPQPLILTLILLLSMSVTPAANFSDKNFQLQDRVEIQQQLKTHGFYTDQIDGRFGPKTKTAIKQFKKSKQLPENLEATSEFWQYLFAQPEDDENALPDNSEQSHDLVKAHNPETKTTDSVPNWSQELKEKLIRIEAENRRLEDKIDQQQQQIKTLTDDRRNGDNNDLDILKTIGSAIIGAIVMLLGTAFTYFKMIDKKMNSAEQKLNKRFTALQQRIASNKAAALQLLKP